MHAGKSLKEKNLFFEGGPGLLQGATRDKAVRCRPHEDVAAGGDVGTVEADGETVFCLWLPSQLLREAGVYGNADVRDDLPRVYWA